MDHEPMAKTVIQPAAIIGGINSPWLRDPATPMPLNEQYPIIKTFLDKLEEKGIKGLQDEYLKLRNYLPKFPECSAFSRHSSKNRYKGWLNYSIRCFCSNCLIRCKMWYLLQTLRL